MAALTVATHSTRTVARPRPRKGTRTTTVYPTALVASAIVLLPLLRPAGPGNTAPVDVPIAVAVVATAVRLARSGGRLRLPYLLPVAVLVVAGALGALHGPFPLQGLVALAQDLFLLGWCAAVAAAGRHPAVLARVVAAWTWSAVAWASILVAAVLTGQTAIAGITQRDGSRAALTFGDANLAADYFVVSLLVVWAAGWPRRRGLRLAAYAVLVAALVTTGSNGGTVCLLVGVTVAVALEAWRRSGPAVAAAAFTALALVGGGAVAAMSSTAVQQAAQTSNVPILRDSVGRTDTSARQRALLLDETLALTRQGGWLGLGPNSTKSALDAAQAPFVKEAHDDYVAALVERGVLGVLGLLALWGALGRMAWNAACRRRLADDYAHVLPRPGGLVGAMAAIAVAGLFYQTLHFRHAWALFGLVAALAWSGAGSVRDQEGDGPVPVRRTAAEPRRPPPPSLADPAPQPVWGRR